MIKFIPWHIDVHPKTWCSRQWHIHVLQWHNSVHTSWHTDDVHPQEMMFSQKHDLHTKTKWWWNNDGRSPHNEAWSMTKCTYKSKMFTSWHIQMKSTPSHEKCLHHDTIVHPMTQFVYWWWSHDILMFSLWHKFPLMTWHVHPMMFAPSNENFVHP